MADNEYYNRLSEMNPGELADGLAIEAEFDAIARGFERLPTPHLDGRGFEEPIRVGDAVNADEAVTKAQLDKALGKAKQLAIATYGNLNAAAWATLDSGTYLLFGTGAQLTNFPAALVAGATYYVTVRHAVGDVGVSLYLDELAFASTDDAANVDLGRAMVRVGADLATAISAGWKKAQPLDATLTAIAGVATAADKLVYFDGVDSAKAAPLTAFARTLLDDVDAVTALNTLGATSRLTTNLGVIGPSGLNSNLDTAAKWDALPVGYSSMIGPSAGLPVSYGFLHKIANRDGGGGFGVLIVGFEGNGDWFGECRDSLSMPVWRRIYTTKNVVGAVSKTSGVPTGAIIERGNNSNGEYIKFADGTLMCWAGYPCAINLPTSANRFGSTSGTGFKMADTRWDFPAVFISTPYVWANPEGFMDHGGVVVHASQSDVAGCIRRAFAGTSIASANVQFFAIGRWI